jgi:hypothetical protein
VTGTYLNDLTALIQRVDPRLIHFTAQVAAEPLIPVEESPLRGSSLTELLPVASSAGLGYLVVEQHPILLLTVPGMIIVVMAARGIGSGFQEVLRTRIVKWLGGSDPDDDETDQSG